VPSTAHAVMQFEQDGGQLTRESSFGTDPLSSYEHLQMLRERDFRCYIHFLFRSIWKCISWWSKNVY